MNCKIMKNGWLRVIVDGMKRQDVHPLPKEKKTITLNRIKQFSALWCRNYSICVRVCNALSSIRFARKTMQNR